MLIYDDFKCEKELKIWSTKVWKINFIDHTMLTDPPKKPSSHNALHAVKVVLSIRIEKQENLTENSLRNF